jgi:tRNA U34 5-methylaminomethyl-2-thiouridine-forming methyltransferase MnmC
MQIERLVGMVIRHLGIFYFRRDEGLHQVLRYVTKRFMENNKFTRDHEVIVVTVA